MAFTSDKINIHHLKPALKSAVVPKDEKALVKTLVKADKNHDGNVDESEYRTATKTTDPAAWGNFTKEFIKQDAHIEWRLANAKAIKHKKEGYVGDICQAATIATHLSAIVMCEPDQANTVAETLSPDIFANGVESLSDSALQYTASMTPNFSLGAALKFWQGLRDARSWEVLKFAFDCQSTDVHAKAASLIPTLLTKQRRVAVEKLITILSSSPSFERCRLGGREKCYDHYHEVGVVNEIASLIPILPVSDRLPISIELINAINETDPEGPNSWNFAGKSIPPLANPWGSARYAEEGPYLAWRWLPQVVPTLTPVDRVVLANHFFDISKAKDGGEISEYIALATSLALHLDAESQLAVLNKAINFARQDCDHRMDVIGAIATQIQYLPIRYRSDMYRPVVKIVSDFLDRSQKCKCWCHCDADTRVPLVKVCDAINVLPKNKQQEFAETIQNIRHLVDDDDDYRNKKSDFSDSYHSHPRF